MQIVEAFEGRDWREWKSSQAQGGLAGICELLNERSVLVASLLLCFNLNIPLNVTTRLSREFISKALKKCLMLAQLRLRFSNYPLMHIQRKTNCRVIPVSCLFLGLSPSQKRKTGKWRSVSGDKAEGLPQHLHRCVSSSVCILLVLGLFASGSLINPSFTNLNDYWEITISVFLTALGLQIWRMHIESTQSEIILLHRIKKGHLGYSTAKAKTDKMNCSARRGCYWISYLLSVSPSCDTQSHAPLTYDSWAFIVHLTAYFSLCCAAKKEKQATLGSTNKTSLKQSTLRKCLCTQFFFAPRLQRQRQWQNQCYSHMKRLKPHKHGSESECHQHPASCGW